MNKILSGLKPVLLTVLLMLASTGAQALESFQQIGTVSKINSTTVYIEGKSINYRLRSSAVLVKANNHEAKIDEFVVGDLVFVKGNILNGVYYVDTMVNIPPLEKEI